MCTSETNQPDEQSKTPNYTVTAVETAERDNVATALRIWIAVQDMDIEVQEGFENTGKLVRFEVRFTGAPTLDMPYLRDRGHTPDRLTEIAQNEVHDFMHGSQDGWESIGKDQYRKIILLDTLPNLA